ncbi:MAG: prepilin-type N-terminal cleavage/methylation domain-containing protein [Vicinamibacterales bacterium]
MDRRDAGFTLVEMIIAMAVMLLILGGVFQAFNPSLGSFQTQPEVADMQQRLRVGTDRLYNGIVVAGAGIYSGAAVGTLGQFFAPVLPYLVGPLHNDPGSGVFFRDDAITIFHVPTTASQCTIRDKMPQPSSEVKVNAEPGCPANDPLCGFEQGMRVIIFDETGSFDFFTITAVQSDALHLQHRPPINPEDFSKAYDVGAVISQVNTDAYYWRQDPATNTFQLMHYDLFSNDVPLIDDVVALRFEYLGEAAPPVLRAPVTDPVGPWTSYGPKPPALGVDVTGDSWPAGENCTFTVDANSGQHVSRLATLGGPGTLTGLTAAQLSDGPWCPDAANVNRYDADLHRVRQIRVTFRVQTGVAVLRGPAGVLFNRAGTGRISTRLVPDQAVQFDVTPRNLNLGR